MASFYYILMKMVLPRGARPDTLTKIFNLNLLPGTKALHPRPNFSAYELMDPHDPQFVILERIMMSLTKVCHQPKPLAISKYDFLAHLITNIFYSESEKAQYKEIFHQTSKVYRGFSRLARCIRIRRTPAHNTMDLGLNPFPPGFDRLRSPIKPSLRPFMLLQNGAKYFFSRADLMNLLSNALGNTMFFFAKPLPCTNPYNKVEFSYMDLINIYHYLRSGQMRIPPLIVAFYECDFSLNKFLLDKEYVIREYAIRQYIMKTDEDELYEDIVDMLDEFCPTLSIHEDFPRASLVRVMRPYLYLFYRSRYSLGSETKTKYRRIFNRKIHEFYQKNPQFGRKVITTMHTRFERRPMGKPPRVHFIEECVSLDMREII
jgi:hypothetical protein